MLLLLLMMLPHILQGAQAQKAAHSFNDIIEELSFKNDNPKTFFKKITLEDFAKLYDESFKRNSTGHKTKRSPFFYACEHNKTGIVEHFLKECKQHKPNLLALIDLPSTVFIKHPDTEVNLAYKGAVSTETPLFIASKKGHYAIVELLLKYGANPNKPAKEFIFASGETNVVTVIRDIPPLGTACLQNAHAKAVEKLLKYGAAVEALSATIFYDETGKKIEKTITESALHNACRNPSHSTEIIKALLKEGASANTLQIIEEQKESSIHSKSALFCCCESRFIQAALLLLAHGANPESGSSIFLMPDTLIPHFEPTLITPLCYAIRSNNRKIVSALLEYKAEVNALSNEAFNSTNHRQSTYSFIATTALIEACCIKDSAIIRELLDAGADINQQTTATKKNSAGTDTTYKHTALIVCCAQNYQDLAQLLIERGADLTLCEEVITPSAGFVIINSPFNLACEHGMNSCVETMLKKGIALELGSLAVHSLDDKVATYEKKTPLFVACTKKNRDLCTLLLTHGANPNTYCLTPHEKNTYFMTPFQKACLSEEIPLIELFLERKYGKNPALWPSVNAYSASINNETHLVMARTALGIATGTASHDVVSYLLMHGANMYLKDKKFFVAPEELNRKYELLDEIITDPQDCSIVAQGPIVQVSPHKIASKIRVKDIIEAFREEHKRRKSVLNRPLMKARRRKKDTGQNVAPHPLICSCCAQKLAVASAAPEKPLLPTAKSLPIVLPSEGASSFQSHVLALAATEETKIVVTEPQAKGKAIKEEESTGRVQATGFNPERFKKLAIKTAKRPEQTTIVLD